jgi:hypothetical protein
MRVLTISKAIALAAIVTTFSAINPAQAALVGSNSTPGNFDSSSGTRTITFTDNETISDLNILIDFAKADGDNTDPPYPTGVPFFNEIVFRLLSPNGTSVDLISENSFNAGSGPGFDGKINFDDQAANVVNVDPNRLQTGLFRPTGSLSAFNGQSSLGNWILSIQDTVGGDSLRFRSATIGINGPATMAAVPTPALLPGLVGLGMGAMRKRKQKAAAQKAVA